MKHFTFFLILISNLSLGFAQNNIDLNSLPDIDEIIVEVSTPGADTIIIGLHGGPSDRLEPGDFSFFEDITTFSVVEIMQYQHLNPEILNDSETTLEQAISYNDTTVAMLQKVILHFTDLGKTVAVIGHSYGGFLLTEYVDDYGMDYVHRVIPMAGRMNMNDEVWMAVVDRFFAFFESDGITPIIPTVIADESEWASMNLLAGVGYNRWIDSLATEDLTNFMYVSGEYDDIVGRLLAEEVDMIESGNGTVLMVPMGDHGSMFDPFYMNQVLAFIRDDQMEVSTNNITENDIHIYPTLITNSLTIATPTTGEITIRNINGELIQNFDCKIGNNEFQLPSLSKGFYVGTFRDSNGQLQSVQKLVAN